MSNAQLPLIPSLTLTMSTSAPARGRRIPLALACEGHRAALQRLLQGPRPLAQVAQVAGEADEKKLVDELRELGLDFLTATVPSPRDSDGADYVVVCQLTKRDIRKVQQYIKKQERNYD